MQLLITGGRRLRLSAGLTFMVAAAALALTTPAASQAAFDLTPCHGSQTAGRGATFPALLHNSGFWGAGFDSSAGCGSTAGAPTHPTYNSSTIDAVGTTAGASKTGSGAGVGACGGGAGGWPAGHRDTTVRFCATDDPLTPGQLQNIDAGCDSSTSPVACTPGLIHQLPWASGAVTVAIHLPEGCVLPAPGSSAASSPTTGYPGDPSGDSTANNTTRPLISDVAIEKAMAGDPAYLYWGQLVPNMTGTPTAAGSGDKQDTTAGETCAGTTAGTGIPVIRIVRSDGSGTTFNFKSFLGLVPVASGGLGNDPSNAGSWTGTTSNTGGTPLGGTSGANTAWPTSGSFTTPFNAGAAGHQTDASNICEWNTDAATGFPGANSAVAANRICGGHGTGASNVSLGILATDGSIGYVDVATARNIKLSGVATPQQDLQDYQTTSGARDYTFWLPVQSNPDQTSGSTWVEPTRDPTNHQATGGGIVGSQGANCTNLPNLQNVPTAANSPGGDVTLGDFSKAIAVGGSGYPICVLTYGLIWDDNSKVYGNSAAEQAQARTVLDYVSFIASSFGQSFVGSDFSTTPASIQNIVRTGTPDASGHGGLAAVDWNKTACSGSSCTTTTNPPPPTTTTTTNTTTTRPPPSNQFTLSGVHAKGKNLVMSVKLPNSGRLTILATFRYKAGKRKNATTVTFANLTATVRAGTGTITLSPTGAARADLAKAKSLSVSIRVTYTPTGGTANTHTASATVHQPGKKKTKHKKKH